MLNLTVLIISREDALQYEIVVMDKYLYTSVLEDFTTLGKLSKWVVVLSLSQLLVETAIIIFYLRTIIFGKT